MQIQKVYGDARLIHVNYFQKPKLYIHLHLLSLSQGMKRLLEYTIELVEDLCHSQYEEEKVSSSSLRKRLLGTLYNPLKVSHYSKISQLIFFDK